MPPAARAVIRACRADPDEGSDTGTAAARDKATAFPGTSRTPEATGHAVKTRASTRISVPFQKRAKT